MFGDIALRVVSVGAVRDPRFPTLGLEERLVGEGEIGVVEAVVAQQRGDRASINGGHHVSPTIWRRIAVKKSSARACSSSRIRAATLARNQGAQLNEEATWGG